MDIQKYKKKIDQVINKIQNDKIYILIPDQSIPKYLDILKQIIFNIPNNIKYYNSYLIPIKHKSKCITCHRDAEYMIHNKENQLYCWRHSQFIIKN